MAIKKESINVRYCDFCDAKQVDDETWVMKCTACGRDACNRCCHRMRVTFATPKLSENVIKEHKFAILLCKECCEEEVKTLKGYLLDQSYTEL